jgi:hypothetical protein
LVKQSIDTYDKQERMNKDADDIADGMILSDEDQPTQPVNWNNISDPLSKQEKELLIKKIESIKRKR